MHFHCISYCSDITILSQSYLQKQSPMHFEADSPYHSLYIYVFFCLRCWCIQSVVFHIELKCTISKKSQYYSSPPSPPQFILYSLCVCDCWGDFREELIYWSQCSTISPVLILYLSSCLGPFIIGAVCRARVHSILLACHFLLKLPLSLQSL